MTFGHSGSIFVGFNHASYSAWVRSTAASRIIFVYASIGSVLSKWYFLFPLQHGCHGIISTLSRF